MTPIPRFPAFRRLEIGDRAAIEAITRQFPPYSDFDFTSLYTWDVDEMCVISMLGGNLVIRFRDYTSDAHFLSFIGQNAVVETTETLLAHARQEKLQPQLRLIPDVVIAADEGLWDRFAVTLDRDNFDYVYTVDSWAHFLHPGFREHRRKMARCRERTSLEHRVLDLSDLCVQDAMLDLFHRWVAQKPGLLAEEWQHELIALRRVFALAAEGQLSACGFHDGERLVAFSVWEGLRGGEYALIHFQKADRAYSGLSSWQANELGRLLHSCGFRLINFEQDLGIPGLHEFKRSLQPSRYLRKYAIAERTELGA
jgi:uncharacterized protein